MDSYQHPDDLFDVPLREDEMRVKYARKDKLHVFWDPENWGLWSSPNMRYLRKPVHCPATDGDHGLLRDWYHKPRKTRWLDTIEPFLAFWPLCPEWIGPFSSLNLIPGRLPVIWWKDGLWYHLHSDVALAWQVLEGKLVRLGTGLLRRHQTLQYGWSEVRPTTLPYEFGYMQHFKHSDDCATAIYRSCSAFIPLTAFVSFAIALDMSIYPPTEGITPDWLYYAVKQLDMDPVWLSELAESFVCNFTPGFRPGSYVRATTAVYKNTYPAFKAGNVPIFINWGFRPPYLLDDSPAWPYRPCHAEAKRAIDIYCNQLSPFDDPRGNIAFWHNMNAPGQSVIPQSVIAQTPSHTLQTHSSPSLANFSGPQVVLEDSPESPSPSHQGEDDIPDPRVDGPEVLLTRLAEERMAAMQHETGDVARRRQTMELQAEVERVDKTLSKPTIGDGMIVWIERGSHVYLPYVVPREKWEDTWCLYTPEERHYTADYNEWILFRNGDFNDGDKGVFPSENSYTRAKAPSEPARLSELGPLRQERRSTKTMEERIEKKWRVRYVKADNDMDGLSSSDDDDDEDYSDTKVSSSKRKRSEVAPTPRKRTNPPDNRLEPHIMNQPVVQSIQQNPTIPSTASRFPSPDAKAVLRNKYRYLMSEPYALSRRMSDTICGEDGEVVTGLSKPMIALKRLGLESAIHTPETTARATDFYNYFHLAKNPTLSPPLWDFAPMLRREIVEHAYFHYHRINSECHVIGIREKPLVDQWYLLVLFDARAVTELFYQQPGSIGQMVRYLIQEGIPFATAKPLRKPPGIPANFAECTLGFRPHTYAFSLSDFSAYVKKKDELLSGSAGRVALMQGGIVWRLAVDAVQHKRVTNGPASSVAWSGKIVGDLNGHSLVDDYLAPAVEDTLCGVYKVYTDQKSQLEDRSWFPKASAWTLSGYNHGYWTADNEKWYQNRLREIQASSKPKNSKEWRAALGTVHAGTVTKFRTLIDTACDKFLQGDLSYWEE